MQRVVVIIPARGGSKGIPRKNIRIMNGKPLISYVIEMAKSSKWVSDVYVTTDDEVIANVSMKYGAKIIARPADLGQDSVTLDPVIFHAVSQIEEQEGKVDVVITMQPTSPTLSVQTFDNAYKKFLKKNVDTLISAVNRPHLSWHESTEGYFPNYTERLNRQYLPKHLQETGGFLISKRECVSESNRIGKVIDLYEVPEKEAIDIDSYDDWIVCEKHLKRKKIVIRTEGYPQIGLGHIYRSILLYDALLEHDVKVVISYKSELGKRKLSERFIKAEVVADENDFYKFLEEYSPDILINDILDTDEIYMQRVSKLVKRVINFEDEGKGNVYASAVINALYEKGRKEDNYFFGPKYYCLREEFLIATPKPFAEKVDNILFIFGGTDPAGYTEKMLEVIEMIQDDEEINYQFVLGLGFDRDKQFMERVSVLPKKINVIKDVAMVSSYMEKADIAVSGQGRTMYELASMKVPTIILAQNEREVRHEFGGIENGFINLGRGDELNPNTIAETLLWLMHTPQIRAQMRKQMEKIELSGGIERVKNIILNNI